MYIILGGVVVLVVSISYKFLCDMLDPPRHYEDDTVAPQYEYGPRGGRYTMGRSWDGGEYKRYR